MDVERTIEFISQAQARGEARLEAAQEQFLAWQERHERWRAEADERAEKDEARLRRAIRLAVEEARNERRKRRELDEKITQVAESLRAFIDEHRRGNGHPS